MITLMIGIAIGFGFFTLLETINEIRETNRYLEAREKHLPSKLKVYRCPHCQEKEVTSQKCAKCISGITEKRVEEENEE